MEEIDLVGKCNIDKELLQRDILSMLDFLGINKKLKGYNFIKELMFIKLLDKMQWEEDRPVRAIARIIEKEYNNGIPIENALKYSINSIWNNEYVKKIYDNKKPRNGNNY